MFKIIYYNAIAEWVLYVFKQNLNTKTKILQILLIVWAP